VDAGAGKAVARPRKRSPAGTRAAQKFLQTWALEISSKTIVIWPASEYNGCGNAFGPEAHLKQTTDVSRAAWRRVPASPFF